MFTHSPTELAGAMSSRESLLVDGMLSRPQTEQRMAVVTSLVMNRVLVESVDAESFLAEKTAILERCRQEGMPTEEVTDVSVSDLISILTDPTITDVCLIGEGSVGSMYARAEENDPRSGIAFDWRDVAWAADHLKTGNIYQRMCSGPGFSAIAWGTFAVANVRNIWISDEESFEPELHDQPHQGLSRAYDDEILDYDTLYRFKTKLRDRQLVEIDNRGDNL